jgi:hypothetical protein
MHSFDEVFFHLAMIFFKLQLGIQTTMKLVWTLEDIISRFCRVVPYTSEIVSY